jgi:hypothetical protein
LVTDFFGGVASVEVLGAEAKLPIHSAGTIRWEEVKREEKKIPSESGAEAESLGSSANGASGRRAGRTVEGMSAWTGSGDDAADSGRGAVGVMVLLGLMTLVWLGLGSSSFRDRGQAKTKIS